MVSAQNQPSTIYETDRSLGEYLLFHYGRPEEQFPWPDGPKEALNFPCRSVMELMDDRTPVRSALDLGCAVGKSSFIMAGFAGKVVGIDFSASFIRAAQVIQKTGELAYRYHEEGSRWREGVAKVDKLSQNVSFEQGDACGQSFVQVGRSHAFAQPNGGLGCSGRTVAPDHSLYLA